MDRITQELEDVLQERLKQFLVRPGLVEQENVRLAAAAEFLSQARASFSDSESGGPVARLRQALEKYLFAAVEIDELVYPQTDPNAGWVRWGYAQPLDANSELMHPELFPLETQLQRLLFDAAGRIHALGYKPRKVDLHAVVTDPAMLERLPSFRFRIDGSTQAGGVFPADPSEATLKAPYLIRNSKVGVEVRFTEQLSATTQLCKQFSIQSGLGAHLNYATTGYKCELWTEGDSCKLVQMELNLLLPQATNHGFLIAPLESFGAVGLSVDAVSTESSAPSVAIPFSSAQGFWGVQITDALNDFVVQYRFSRPLRGGTFEHLYFTPGDDKSYYGTRLTLEIDGKLLADLSRPLTLFFSIM